MWARLSEMPIGAHLLILDVPSSVTAYSPVILHRSRRQNDGPPLIYHQPELNIEIWVLLLVNWHGYTHCNEVLFFTLLFSPVTTKLQFKYLQNQFPIETFRSVATWCRTNEGFSLFSCSDGRYIYKYLYHCNFIILSVQYGR